MKQALLNSLAFLYEAGVRVRNQLFDRGVLRSEAVPCPVISIGNISAGGSGKTPFAGYIAAELVERARRPVVLSRGYGGTVRGPQQVGPLDGVLEVGDEAVMQAKLLYPAAKVVVARSRVAGARYVVDENLGDVIVLDDALQHRWLDRDIDILLLDITAEESVEAILRNGMIPAGPLREPLDCAIKRAGILVLVRRSAIVEEFQSDPRLVELFGDTPTFRYWLRPVEFQDVVTGTRAALDSFSGAECSAITAIAKGERFFSMLEQLGLNLTYKKAFRDHYLFTISDWQEIERSSEGPILMTLKDAVKLEPYIRVPQHAYILRIGGEFATLDERQRFWKLVTRATRIN